MKFSKVYQMLAAGANPQSGSELSNEQAIQLAESEFPRKPWCLVRHWVIYDISPEKLGPLPGFGKQPTMMYADTIVLDEQNRWESGEWVRSSPLESFAHGCLFETANTVYVLLGDGRRAGVIS